MDIFRNRYVVLAFLVCFGILVYRVRPFQNKGSIPTIIDTVDIDNFDINEVVLTKDKIENLKKELPKLVRNSILLGNTVAYKAYRISDKRIYIQDKNGNEVDVALVTDNGNVSWLAGTTEETEKVISKLLALMEYYSSEDYQIERRKQMQERILTE